MVIANGWGLIRPLLMVRLHIDPAVILGSLMNALFDATGRFIHSTIARVIPGP